MPRESTRSPDAATGAPTKRERQRRKEARPTEIIQAALQLFTERGFGPTRLEDVAKRAGVSKGTLFVYFPNKVELFRSVVQTVLASQLERVSGLSIDVDRPLEEFVPTLLRHGADTARSGLPSMARLLVAESHAFPDLARVWHDEVVSKTLGLLTMAIQHAQDRGEIRAGDPQLHAFSIMGPMMAAALFADVLQGSDAKLPDLTQLAAQHADTVLRGLKVRA